MMGGTVFAGRAVVDEALARGHEVTVFNRGVSGVPALGDVNALPGVRAIRGDRLAEGEVERLAGEGEWDVVVDTWTRAPGAVRAAARALAGVAGRYVYVSSASVYDHERMTADRTESARTLSPAPDEGDDRPEGYGHNKRGGEAAAEQEFGPERVLLARCGLMVGPGEVVGRLPYWLRRAAAGGEMVAPGPADLDIQWLDIRDMAAFLLDAAGAGRSGPYNLVSPVGALRLGAPLEECVRVTGSAATLRWIDAEVLLAAGVEPWNELPLWIPEGHPYRFLHGWDVSRALADGLRIRPVAETVADTWAWVRELGTEKLVVPGRPEAWLTPERERELLAG
ncbi:hypothetical protein BIV57_18560 [Mangrovactinospora gilvigrisea]|uniref:NAD-dependent epimerase/dehydratase domain-containing protein n=1 Tax=Mangrovactinospora gilvigrisea TaxID=1428644 RepID=A0A1J7BBK1_9ACTN|nr:hypothetical protein BIV57_18560 [Mangrovactinospora gilvigrisea]